GGRHRGDLRRRRAYRHPRRSRLLPQRRNPAVRAAPAGGRLTVTATACSDGARAPERGLGRRCIWPLHRLVVTETVWSDPRLVGGGVGSLIGSGPSLTLLWMVCWCLVGVNVVHA